MATKKFIIEVEEGWTKCDKDCPFAGAAFLGYQCGLHNEIGFGELQCTKYNFATMKITKIEEEKMREETLINAVNDIDDIRCKLEDIHQDIMEQPDYWEKLKHQYAGMAMQGILSNNNLLNFLCEGNKKLLSKIVLDNADIIATALVNRLKEEEK